MEDKKNSEINGQDIKEALGKLNVDYVEATVTEKNTNDGIIELEFVNEQTGGFVFEDETALPEAQIEQTLSEQSAEEIVEEPEIKEAPIAAEPEEEFSIPAEFEVSERYDTPETPNEQTKIWTTYVPRFTDVSNTYRMSDDPRPRSAAPVSTEVKVNNTDVDPSVDPTAEIDREITDAVTVTGEKSVKLEEYAETLNVYKFANERSESVPPVDKSLSYTRAKDNEPDDSLDSESSSEQIAEVPQTTLNLAPEPTSAPEKRGPIHIPDPDSTVHMIDCDGQKKGGALAKYEIPPRGVGATVAQMGKKDRSGEYTAFFQRDNFKDKFLDTILSVKIRLFSIAFIALILLVYENLAIFGVDVAQLLRISSAPGSPLALVDLHLAFCAFALSLPEIIDSLKSLGKKQLLPEFFLIPSFLVLAASVVEDYVSMDPDPVLFGFVFAFQAFITVYASCIRRNADFTAFKAVSQNGEKKVLDISQTRTLPRENLALDGAVDSYKSGTVRVFRTSFISDFFKRVARKGENTFNNVVMLSVSAGIALVLSVVVGFLQEGISSAFDAFSLTFMTAIPTFSLLIHKLPYSRAEKESVENKTVIIGESSLYEFSSADVITFEDTEIFGTEDVVLKRFMLYGDRENMGKAMRQMSALFSVVGGPLDHIFANSLDKRPVPATNPVIEDDGISGSVDGKRVCAGTFEYMQRHGISVHRDSGSSDGVSADTMKVMYSAEGDSVYAKFYIRYSFSEAFSKMLPSIKERSIVPLIYTRDPNISNDLLKTLTAGQSFMRVMKRNDLPATETKSYTRVDAGIVTFGDKMNAIKAVLLAKKYAILQEKLAKAELILTGVGAFSAVILSLFKLWVPSLFVALWHAICCLALHIAAVKLLSDGKKIKENDNN